jgi:Uma2 family endonuclease
MGNCMAEPHASRVTPAEYLEYERRSEEKHEYLAGRIYAMAGGSPKHNLVSGNVVGALLDRLRGQPCVAVSGQHVFVEAAQLGTYPDVTVLCGPAAHNKDFPQSLINPSILVEVLSPSTEAYDRGAKFAASRRCASTSWCRRTAWRSTTTCERATERGG